MNNKALTVEQRFINILKKDVGIESKITPTSSFVNDLYFDTIDTTEMLMAIEEEFKIEIHYADVIDIHTVQDLIDFITKHNQQC